jgi:hypothetical protein
MSKCPKLNTMLFWARSSLEPFITMGITGRLFLTARVKALLLNFLTL